MTFVEPGPKAQSLYSLISMISLSGSWGLSPTLLRILDLQENGQQSEGGGMMVHIASSHQPGLHSEALHLRKERWGWVYVKSKRTAISFSYVCIHGCPGVCRSPVLNNPAPGGMLDNDRKYFRLSSQTWDTAGGWKLEML